MNQQDILKIIDTAQAVGAANNWDMREKLIYLAGSAAAVAEKERDALSAEVERLKAINQKLQSLNTKYQLEHQTCYDAGKQFKAERDELQRRIDAAMTQEPDAWLIRHDEACQLSCEIMKTEAEAAGHEMQEWHFNHGEDGVRIPAIISPLYLKPFPAPATGWQPIETIPHDQYVDVWVISKNNPYYGARVVNACRTDRHTSGWVNILPWMIPTHWMPPPSLPAVDLTPLLIDSEGGHCD